MHDFDLTFLQRLVNINSQTQNIPGVKKAQELLAYELSMLGMDIQWYSNKKTESADALVATAGEGPFVITLLGHSDTVAKGGEFFPFERTAGGRILGAGIADMKGGLAVIIASLKKALLYLKEEVTIKVVVSPNEEVGSPGFQELFASEGKNSDLVLCFEPALPDGSFIGGRNGNRWYDLTFTGDKLHSGRAPKGSPNILHKICHLQQALQEQANKEENLKFNITSINCDNDKHNVTSSEAVVKMDVRFTKVAQRESFHQEILRWKKEAGASLQLSVEDDCPPMANFMGEDVVLELSENLTKAHGISIFCRHCEGASDANYFSHPGNIVLDGLGPEGALFHSRKEYLIESTLAKRTQGLTKFLMNLNVKNFSEVKKVLA